jgi:hypothetical protein
MNQDAVRKITITNEIRKKKKERKFGQYTSALSKAKVI